MLKTLVKKQLMEIFRSYFYNAKTNKKRSTAGIIAYILFFAALMIGLIGGMFTGLSVSLCAPLTQAGMGWLYFALMSLLAIFLGAFGSVFNTYSGLYFAKDNDLLLSLPIPVRALMASRLLTVYLMGPHVLRGRHPARGHRLLGHGLGGADGAPRRRAADGAHLNLRAHALVRAGLGRGEGEP